MCITVKKILGSDMPKSQKCRAIYQKGVYVHGYNNSDIRSRSVQARKLRAWFRTETIPVDPWWGTDNGSDYLCHIMSQWISQGCPVIDISEFDEESQEAIVQGSRFAFLDETGLHLYGDFVKHNGLLLSNTRFLRPVISTRGITDKLWGTGL